MQPVAKRARTDDGAAIRLGPGGVPQLLRDMYRRRQEHWQRVMDARQRVIDVRMRWGRAEADMRNWRYWDDPDKLRKLAAEFEAVRSDYETIRDEYQETQGVPFNADTPPL